MHEVGIALFLIDGQRHPRLNTVQPGRRMKIIAGPLGMHDAATCGHEVDCPGLNGLHEAQAVTVHDLAFE